MNDLKKKFTLVLIDQCKIDTLESTFEDLMHKIWYNIRKKNNSFRLTDIGLEYVLQADIRTYEIEFPKDLKITAQILIWLDNYLESPYHLTNKKITVITEKSAIELHLFSGDLLRFGTTKTINKRITQNLNL